MKKSDTKEVISYLVMGVLTTVVSLGIYYALIWTVLDPSIPLQLQVANVLSWIGAVIFAYITNRKYVFHSKNQNIMKELRDFVGSRLVSLLVDMAIMFVFVSLLKQNANIFKLVSQVVVIVLNYVLSKLVVFR